MSTRGWLALALRSKRAGKREEGALGAYQQTPFLTSRICNRVRTCCVKNGCYREGHGYLKYRVTGGQHRVLPVEDVVRARR